MTGVVVPDATETGDVPVTEVIVPPPVPAPMAARKSAAFNAETVLSALKRGKVITLGFGIVNILPPKVVAPRLIRAPAAVTEPVPPLATGTVCSQVGAVLPFDFRGNQKYLQ